MNSVQRSVLAMSLVTIDYVNGVDSSIIGGIPLFDSYYSPFKNNVNLLNNELVSQMMNRKGYAVDKKDIKEKMCLLGDAISDDVVAYAININDSILEGEMTFTYSELQRLGDAECVAANQLIYDKAKANLGDLATYGVDGAMIDKYIGLIHDYQLATPAPKNQLIDKKMATGEIKDLFMSNTVYLNKMDKLVKVLKLTKPDFVAHYFASRKLVRASFRSLAARILVADEENNPLEKVLVTNKGIGLKRRTTAKGQIYLKNLEDHVYVLVFSKSGYETQEVNLPVTKGERTDITVVMKRIVN